MAADLLLPVRHVARITVEAVTPISICSGAEDADIDAPLYRDWNELPCLAGTGLAGILRSLHVDYYGEDKTRKLFGQSSARGVDEKASRLIVSFGVVHDQEDRAVDSLLLPDEISQDPVLSLLQRPAPLLRDSVSIDSDTGAAVHGGKFDRAACPIGTRFTFEIAVDAEPDASHDELKAVAALLMSPYARVGGAARRGLGRLKLERVAHAAIDRRGADGRERWIAYRKSRLDERPSEAGLRWEAWNDLKLPRSRRGPIQATLRLRPKTFWRIGKGTRPWTEGEKNPDQMPLTEPIIVWSEDGICRRGTVVDRPLAPIVSAGIKGAIAHRAEYHLRRIDSDFSRPDSSSGGDDRPCSATRRRLMDGVLGAVAKGDGGQAGVLFIDDVVIDFTDREKSKRVARRVRNSLDRHTGGTRNGKLFTLEAYWKAPAFSIPLVILTRDAQGEPWLTGNVARAIDWAVEDLVSGRLAIGAGDAVGDGVVEGQIWWGNAQETLEAVLATRD